jgi:hypothetical protein
MGVGVKLEEVVVMFHGKPVNYSDPDQMRRLVDFLSREVDRLRKESDRYQELAMAALKALRPKVVEANP